MAIYCPLKNGPALYLECKECEDKEKCKTTRKSIKKSIKNKFLIMQNKA